MADVATAEDLKNAYQLGLAERHMLSIPLLKEKLGFSAAKANAVLKRLIGAKACSELRQDARGEAICAVRTQEVAMRLKKCCENPNTYKVFCVVEQAGQTGISSRDIVQQTKLPAPTVNQGLKSLEIEKLVKQIKSIHTRGRKLFMLAYLEADESVVGGTFYVNGEFDEDLVEQYRERILFYVNNKGAVSLNSLVEHLKTSAMKRTLELPDLQIVLRSLVLDQMINSWTSRAKGDQMYAPAGWPDFSDLETLPCISCPHFDVCQIEDIDRFDALMLRQALTTADKRRQQKAMTGKKEATGPSAAAGGAGSSGLLLTSALSSTTTAFTSKINPSTCPYYSQWLGLEGVEPTVPKLTDESTGVA